MSRNTICGHSCCGTKANDGLQRSTLDVAIPSVAIRAAALTLQFYSGDTAQPYF